MALGDPYCTPDRLQAYLGVNDALDYIEAEIAVTAGSQWVTEYCARDFNDAGAVSERVFRPHTSVSVFTDDFSTTTGLVVKDGDTGLGTWSTTRVSAAYQAEPLNGRTVSGRAVPFDLVSLRTTCWAPGTVAITARWGWAAVPDAVELATLMVAARLFKRKEAPEGVAGGFQQFSAVGTQATDPDVTALLAPYRRFTIGFR